MQHKTVLFIILILISGSYAYSQTNYSSQHSKTQACYNYDQKIYDHLIWDQPVSLIILYDLESTNFTTNDENFNFSDGEPELKQLANSTSQALLNIFPWENFSILDRTGLSNILAEHRLQATGLTTQTVKNIGEISGATHILQLSIESNTVWDYPETFAYNTNYFKLFSVDNGKLLSSDSEAIGITFNLATKEKTIDFHKINYRDIVVDPSDGLSYFK